MPSWEDFYGDVRPFPDMLRWGVTHSMLVEELVRHRRVLEVGSGTAMLSSLVSRFCDVTVTVDNSPGVLGTANAFIRSVGARVPAVLGDAFALPFGADTFDACFSQGLLEHFSDVEIQGLVAQQLRVAPVAYVSVPSVYYPHAGRRGPGLIGNERLLGRRAWERILGRWPVTSRYYADFKVASFAGRTLPWPAQLLLRVGRG